MNTTTQRLTAEQAAKISDEHDHVKAVDSILAEVQKQAHLGRRTLRVNGYGFSSGECVCERQHWPERCRRIQDELIGLGYKAFLYKLNNVQFVDIWLEVSW